jgi:hypothetical protein
MKPLTAAAAWCWAARLYAKESDAAFYRYPRTESDMHDANEAQDIADACRERAVKLGADEATWREAVAKWNAPEAQAAKQGDAL